jgi:hypothetical protein
MHQFILSGDFYEYYGSSDTNTFSNTVLFEKASIIVPEKPEDNADAAIVGYEWELVPEVIEVLFSDDETTMQVYTQWKAGSSFSDDGQAALYTEDAGQDPEAWGASSGDSAVGTPYEDLINTYLTGQGEDNIALSDNANQDIYNKSIRVPVAAYNWDISESKISRVVQLLFGSAAPGSTSNSLSGESTLFMHPFMGQVVSETSISIGRLRADADYKFKDSITITDPEDDTIQAISYPAEEIIALDTTYDYYVYYDIHKGSTQWESTLKKSKVWPPEDPGTLAKPSAGNIIKLLGFAKHTYDAVEDVNSYIWGQEMFDCPFEVTSSIRGEFSPIYELDGSVTILEGTVETFNNNSATISGGTYDLSIDTDIWVRVQSTASAGTPVVGITGLYSGGFPGKYTSVSDTVKNFNYLIGEVRSGTYTPAHEGKIQIDNTMLMPLIDSDYYRLTNSPRMMAFHTNQPTSVGTASRATRKKL